MLEVTPVLLLQIRDMARLLLASLLRGGREDLERQQPAAGAKHRLFSSRGTKICP